jgi:hypothetical protein
MDAKPRSRPSKRAALLASTALIALLTACQTTDNGSGSSTSGNSQHEYHYYGWGGYAW